MFCKEHDHDTAIKAGTNLSEADLTEADLSAIKDDRADSRELDRIGDAAYRAKGYQREMRY